MRFGPRSLWDLLRKAAAGWKADGCASMGAALAFYSLLSMGPLLVLVILVAGLVIGRDEAETLLMTQLSGLLGDAGAEGVKNVLNAASTREEGLVKTAISFAVLLLGATRVLGELQENLNRIWKAEAPKVKGVWRAVRKKLLSFGLIIVLGLLLVVSLAVSAAVAFVGDTLLSGAAESMAHVLELAGSLLVTTLLFALTFKFLPSRRIAWGDVFLGAFITAILFGIGKFAIGLYIGKSAVASDFGAAGTLVVAILWVYYSSQIFFFGAEFTRAYSLSVGSKRMEAANSEFASGEQAMIDRAEKIVKGRDPILLQKRT